MTPFPRYRLQNASVGLFLAAFASIVLYALFDVRWWPRIGHQDLWRGVALGFLHVAALVQLPLLFGVK